MAIYSVVLISQSLLVNTTDSKEFPGKAFVKDEVFKALRLGHSQANSYASMFSSRAISKLPKIKAWVGDPGGTEGDQYRDMTMSEFKEYMKTRLGKVKKSADVKGKKRAQADSSDDGDMEETTKKKFKKGRAQESDSEDEVAVSKKKAKKGKVHRSVHSSEIDEEE